MKKYITKPVVYTLYGISLFLIVVGLVVIGKEESLKTVESPNGVYNILSGIDVPVSKEQTEVVGRPYTDMNVEIVQNYYNYKGTEEEQQNSLIYYQDTYIQSTGVSYQLEGKEFDAVAILDGEVIEVKEDELLGNSVTIKHSSNVISIYQSIQDIQVKEGDIVRKGMLIGTSGTSNISSDLENHLYFELMVDNISVNPEEYYDKTL
jgi:stage II sporulation protein Q